MIFSLVSTFNFRWDINKLCNLRNISHFWRVAWKVYRLLNPTEKYINQSFLSYIYSRICKRCHQFGDIYTCLYRKSRLKINDQNPNKYNLLSNDQLIFELYMSFIYLAHELSVDSGFVIKRSWIVCLHDIWYNHRATVCSCHGNSV